VIGAAFSAYLARELKLADPLSPRNRTSVNFHAYLASVASPQMALFDFAADSMTREWLTRLTAAETAPETAPAAGERAFYPPEKEHYLRMIRENIARRRAARTVLYIGSAGDISTALACTDAATFIFVDALPFDRMDAEENGPGRDAYIGEKTMQGWSRSETLDLDVLCARLPIIWELEALGVQRSDIIMEVGVDRIPVVRFTLPGDDRERTIRYYRIASAYNADSYPAALREEIAAGIDVCMTKAFHRIAMPPAVTGLIIDSLNPGGVILTDDSNQWLADNAASLADVTGPEVRNYEQEHAMKFGYDEVNVFARRGDVSLHVIGAAAARDGIVAIYRNQLRLPSAFHDQFIDICIDPAGNITVYTREAFRNAAYAVKKRSEQEQREFYNAASACGTCRG
jgi:hypothetical protein